MHSPCNGQTNCKAIVVDLDKYLFKMNIKIEHHLSFTIDNSNCIHSTNAFQAFSMTCDNNTLVTHLPLCLYVLR